MSLVVQTTFVRAVFTMVHGAACVLCKPPYPKGCRGFEPSSEGSRLIAQVLCRLDCSRAEPTPGKLSFPSKYQETIALPQSLPEQLLPSSPSLGINRQVANGHTSQSAKAQ
jgi:hypothetical protein